MTRSVRRWLASVAGLVIALPILAAAPAHAEPSHPDTLITTENGPEALRSGARKPGSYRVLVFTKTTGERRASIPAAVAAIRLMGVANGFRVDETANAGAFTAANLGRYRAVVFLNTTGDVLNDAQQSAFEQYFTNGGGYLGVHAAAETEPDWDFYRDLVGTSVSGRLPVEDATIDVADRAHPSTERIARKLTLSEEWYNFAGTVRGTAHVLATLDESTVTGGTMGHDHPVSWCRDYQGGRTFYTGLGHSTRSYLDSSFRRHLLGGLQWAAGVVEGDCGATVTGNYEKVVLNDEPGEPMSLAVLPDGRVLHNTRGGQVRLYDPASGASPVINTIEVYQHDEDGLQSVALDPQFATNGWVYIYYAPRLDTPTTDAPVTSPDPAVWDAYKGYNQLSRVKFVETPTPHLDMSTEQQIMRVDVDRGVCCHVAGEIKFDGNGLLYLVTGDDTNAGGSDGYTPINESPTQGPGYDAQRSSGNTNDLRGKVLRIRVNADGTYGIPAGNLFDERRDTAGKTRPEIFLMGLRNPFRFDVDERGYVYVGDYSPDSQVPSATRGPEGTGRWFATNKAGNYGWPYCYSPTLPYIDYDFVTKQSKGAFDCAAPVNDSPRNTGLTTLPGVAQPDFWYTFQARTPCAGSYLSNPPTTCDFKWPVIGTGGVGPMGGPVYDYDPRSASESKFPEYYDNAVVFGEFTRDKIFMMRTDGNGNLTGVEQFLPGVVFDNPMDMEYGPDGNLYVLEYGDGFFRANPDAALSVIRYAKGTRAPVAAIEATPDNGQAPLTVQFSSEGTYDPDPGESISYAWDFTSDGTVDSADPNPAFTYTANGVYTARLTVTDSSGKTAQLTHQIVVGNTRPTVTVTSPISGTFFNWGDTVPWTVTVTDPEDGPIDCSRVTVSFVLGHDTHGHGMSDANGCSGSFVSPADGADHAGGYLYGAISAKYTDLGANGQPALEDVDQAVLQTWRQQAEFAQQQLGVTTANTNDTGGGTHLTGFDPNEYVAFDPINLGGVGTVTLRYAGGSAATAGQPRATVTLRLDAPDGPIVGSATLAATASGTTWASQTVPVSAAPGSHRLYLVTGGVEGGPTTGLFNLNWVEFAPQ
ncbi:MULTISPECIES: ThuA domain-containing protein [Catenuloplanes]|uniref:Glucose/arabinose dehydrogenase/PKD repeat protein/type 1 glutamine amidotransferase n=1 Tax=Catenuloplanes niger TaxID=587534 RepID=A0AAE3ZZS9_9ACTN|nr:ThuA domain-containing protein [Catenuloplanes niger]MDR7328269.1 glucose/arabinose dehydrogenase/PKD repeat protein/type 1 glutamine amidotransferase [Catenuloplanes niger]